MISSGSNAFRNYVFFRLPLTSRLFRWWWVKNNGGPRIEGLSLPDAGEIKRAVSVPVLCTGGFQTASVIRRAIEQGYCDAVSIARPVGQMVGEEAGQDAPDPVRHAVVGVGADRAVLEVLLDVGVDLRHVARQVGHQDQAADGGDDDQDADDGDRLTIRRG